MIINPEIEEILEKYKINKDAGILYLLAIHFNVLATIVPEMIKSQVALTKIVEKDYQNEGVFKWNIPLFEGQEIAWEWVKDWMKPFKQINPERSGIPSECINRMKKMFSLYPEIRKEDVYKARDSYIQTVKSSEYLKTPHKFIYEGTGTSRTSMMMQFYYNNLEKKEKSQSDVI